MKPTILFITLVFGAAIILCGINPIHALRIAVFTIEESGHILPMSAIAHAAVAAGHTIDIFMPHHVIEGTRYIFPCKKNPQQCNFVRIYGGETYRADLPENFTMYEKVTETDTLTGFDLLERGMQNWSIEMIPPTIEAISRFYGTEIDNADGSKTIKKGEVSKPDVVLADYSWSNLLLAVSAATILRSVPSVFLWPLTLSMPIALPSSYIPALSTGLTAKEISTTWWKRLVNYGFQRMIVFAQRTSNKLPVLLQIAGAPPSAWDQFDEINDIFTNHFVITPNIFGLDLGQPMCPNIRPVGFLRMPMNSEEENEIPQEWMQWLNECHHQQENKPKTGNVKKYNGTLYVNMGSVAIMPVAWLHGMERVLRHLVEEEGICVIWKMRVTEQAKLLHPPQIATELVRAGVVVASGALNPEAASAKDAGKKDATALPSHTKPTKGNRLAIVSRVPFPPFSLLSKGHVGAFVSHCGDTSVYESVDALVPIVGIPLFADQPDMCARIVDAGVGVSVSKHSLILKNSTKKSSSSSSRRQHQEAKTETEGEVEAQPETGSKNVGNENENDEPTKETIKSSPLYQAIQTVLSDRAAGDERSASMVSKLKYI